MTEAVRAIRAKKALPFTMGGDHSVTFPILRAFEGSRPITVVQFDAHMDYRDEAMGVRYGHGNVLRWVRELDWVEKVVAIGIRSLRTRQEDYEASRRDGNTVIPAWDVHAHGVDHFAADLPEGRDVYVTFDIDGMDASVAPGTGTPEVGGLSYEQARRFLEFRSDPDHSFALGPDHDRGHGLRFPAWEKLDTGAFNASGLGSAARPCQCGRAEGRTRSLSPAWRTPGDRRRRAKARERGPRAPQSPR